jgi:sugar lactone lactonase YvrE
MKTMKEFTLLGIGALLVAQVSTTAIAQNIVPVAILSEGFNIQGVAVDAQDNIYVSDRKLSVIYKVTPFGVVSSFAQMPNVLPADMAFDANGNFCCCTASSGAIGAQQGIYKVSPDGNVSLFSSIPESKTLSGIALDAEGNIYASDEALAATGIWKIDREGNAQVWSSSSLFATATPAGYPVSPFPLGVAANGLALSLDDKTLYVDATEAGMIVAVPVNEDGSVLYVANPATNLADTSWITLTNLTLTISPQVFVDTTAPARSEGFYRAVIH